MGSNDELSTIYDEMFSNKEFVTKLESILKPNKIIPDTFEAFIDKTVKKGILVITHHDNIEHNTYNCSPKLIKRFEYWFKAVNPKVKTNNDALLDWYNKKVRPYYSLSNNNTVMTLDTSFDSNDLISLEIPEGVTIISRESDITYPNLHICNIHFPKSIERIKKRTFSRQKLETINFADMSGSPVFEEGCFRLCKNLEEINLPSHSMLCWDVFGSRGHTIKFHYHSTMTFNGGILALSLGLRDKLNDRCPYKNKILYDTIIFDDDAISSDTFHGTEFGHAIFKNWDNITIIKENAFCYSRGKDLLFIEDRNTQFRLPDNIKEIEDRAFYNSTMLPEKLTIPKSLTKLGKDVFTGSSLKTIECTPEQLTFIKQSVPENKFEFHIIPAPCLTTLGYEFKCEQGTNVQDITITLPSKMYVISCITNDVRITAFITNKPDELTDTVKIKYTSTATVSFNAHITLTVKQPD